MPPGVHPKTSQNFMGAEVSSPLSQEPCIDHYLESQQQIFVRIHCFSVLVLKIRQYVLEGER
jgi:hypothetical protein